MLQQRLLEEAAKRPLYCVYMCVCVCTKYMEVPNGFPTPMMIPQKTRSSNSRVSGEISFRVAYDKSSEREVGKKVVGYCCCCFCYRALGIYIYTHIYIYAGTTSMCQNYCKAFQLGFFSLKQPLILVMVVQWYGMEVRQRSSSTTTYVSRKLSSISVSNTIVPLLQQRHWNITAKLMLLLLLLLGWDSIYVLLLQYKLTVLLLFFTVLYCNPSGKAEKD